MSIYGVSESATDQKYVTKETISHPQRNIYRYPGVHINNLGTLGNELKVSKGAGNLDVNIEAGFVTMDGADGTTMYTVRSDSQTTITLDPVTHTVGQTRIDLIIVRIATGGDSKTIEKITGTPNTTGSEVRPSIPALTEAYYVLASISIVGGTVAINNSMITDERQAVDLFSNNLVSGWASINYGLEFNDSTSIKTSSNIDLTNIISVGDKFTFTQSSTIKYFYVEDINYNSTVASRTYIKLRGYSGATVANSTLSKVQFSKINKPLNFPIAPIFVQEGQLRNGKIVVTESGGNLTVAIKTLAGTDPSPSNPVSIMIDGVDRSITSALSVTANAGTNWLNLGASEHATKENDLFVFLQWNTTTSSVNILSSRIGYPRIVGDFVNSTTDKKGVIGIVNYNSTDSVASIGRFKATLSSGAGYTWTVPTFTRSNLIQSPIISTEWTPYTATLIGEGSMTYTSIVTNTFSYKLDGRIMYLRVYANGTTGGTLNNRINFSIPFDAVNYDNNIQPGVGIWGQDGSLTSFVVVGGDTSGYLGVAKSDNSNYTAGSSRYFVGQLFIEI